MLGLLGVWNATFLQYPCRALLPYAQPLVRFAAHIQQVDMESNGKRVAMDGARRCPSPRAKWTSASRAPTGSTASTS